MSNLQKVTPEGFEIANAYLQYGTAEEVATQLQIPLVEVATALKSREVKAYLDGIYLDQGYRNRDKLGKLLDEIIDQKLEEARESEMFTNKDLVDLITLAHKMRMDELKLDKDQATTTVNVANFGEGNYGQLMERLLTKRKE